MLNNPGISLQNMSGHPVYNKLYIMSYLQSLNIYADLKLFTVLGLTAPFRARVGSILNIFN